jgi:hypothetical protein
MLQIDRVQAEMEILPGAGELGGSSVPPLLPGANLDPAARQRLSELVLEALRDHLRELERRGTL